MKNKYILFFKKLEGMKSRDELCHQIVVSSAVLSTKPRVQLTLIFTYNMNNKS